MNMSTLIKQFSRRNFDAQADTIKSKCLVILSKGKICGHLVAGKIFSSEIIHTEQFKEFKEYEQKKKTLLKWKQYEAGNYSIFPL